MFSKLITLGATALSTHIQTLGLRPPHIISQHPSAVAASVAFFAGTLAGVIAFLLVSERLVRSKTEHTAGRILLSSLFAGLVASLIVIIVWVYLSSPVKPILPGRPALLSLGF